MCAQLFPADSACHQHPAQRNIMIRAQVTHTETHSSVLEIQPRMLMLQRPLVKHAVGEEHALQGGVAIEREHKHANKKGQLVMADSNRQA